MNEFSMCCKVLLPVDLHRRQEQVSQEFDVLKILLQELLYFSEESFLPVERYILNRSLEDIQVDRQASFPEPHIALQEQHLQ